MIGVLNIFWRAVQDITMLASSSLEEEEFVFI